jgi:CubicO group peptidase (beta-lactamase class C family)
VDAIFSQWNRRDSPGCAVSVLQNGRIVYEKGYGMADLEHDTPITPTTVFHVASMSKQFTATAILLLVQQGKLSLDEDIRRYLPEMPKFATPITIRQLMHHTSGLRDQWDLLNLAGWRYSEDLITDDDIMSLLARQKELNFKPGERELYSNSGYTVLGQIVKRVSGMTLREFTTKNIFEPLGMKNTHFRDDHAEVIKNNALGYERAKDSDPFRQGDTQFDTVGATSLHTTVEDLALWDENFYNPRVGGPTFGAQMLERGKLNSGEQQDYASGLAIEKYKGLEMVHHGGADAGYRADLVRFSQQHFSAAVLCNTSEVIAGVLAEHIADIYLAEQIKASGAQPSTRPNTLVAVQPSEQQLASHVGLYWDGEDDQFVKAYMKDGKLRLSFGSDDDVLLSPVSETHFRPSGTPYDDIVDLAFEPAAGRPARLLYAVQNDKPLAYELVGPFNPSAAELASYAGEYASEEIDPVYRFVVQEGKLQLIRLKHKPAALDPRTRDFFSVSFGTIHFTRDANGAISGFLLDTDRVKKFRFTRRKG